MTSAAVLLFLINNGKKTLAYMFLVAWRLAFYFKEILTMAINLSYFPTLQCRIHLIFLCYRFYAIYSIPLKYYYTYINYWKCTF